MESVQPKAKLDTVLECLVLMARLHDIPVQGQQIRRAYVTDRNGMDLFTLLRASRDLGLKAKLVRVRKEHLQALPRPFMAAFVNGNEVIVLRLQSDHIILLDPYQAQPVSLSIKKFLSIWKGEAVLFTRRYEGKEKERRFGLSWFLPILAKYRKPLLQVLGISFLLQLFGLISPLFTQVIIDKVLVHRSLSTLDVMVLGMAMVAIFQMWLSGLRSYIFTHTTNQADVILSTKLFQHIMSLPVKYFSQWKIGDVVARVRELEKVRQFITSSALTLILDAVFTIVYIAAMFVYSIPLSFLALLALPVYIILNLIVTPIYHHRINANFDADAANQAFLIEAVTGIQAVKSSAVENHFRHKWEQMLAHFIKTSFATTNLANFAGNIGTFIQQFFVVAILWYGAHLVMRNELTVGGLIAFQMMSGQVIAPVLRIVNTWQSFQQTKVSLDKLGDIMNYEMEASFDPTRTTLPELKGAIRFERVSFRYRPDLAEVLYQFSFQIQPGQTIGIVGRSGSGKSTITKLIQRLYVPDSGRVLVDGVDLAQIEPAWLRRQIGVVLQDDYLFNGTIAENIAIAAPDATQDDIVRAAGLSGASEFIKELPKQYDAVVGERGTALSGGQRQRVAIARALITDPRILIFDEATSALDYESEHIIMQNLAKISAGRTMIMIAHRLATVRRADQILVIDHGRIAEMGKHEELLAQKGIYASLWMQQQGMPFAAGPVVT